MLAAVPINCYQEIFSYYTVKDDILSEKKIQIIIFENYISS